MEFRCQIHLDFFSFVKKNKIGVQCLSWTRTHCHGELGTSSSWFLWRYSECYPALHKRKRPVHHNGNADDKLRQLPNMVHKHAGKQLQYIQEHQCPIPKKRSPCVCIYYTRLREPQWLLFLIKWSNMTPSNVIFVVRDGDTAKEVASSGWFPLKAPWQADLVWGTSYHPGGHLASFLWKQQTTKTTGWRARSSSCVRSFCAAGFIQSKNETTPNLRKCSDYSSRPVGFGFPNKMKEVFPYSGFSVFQSYKNWT